MEITCLIISYVNVQVKMFSFLLAFQLNHFSYRQGECSPGSQCCYDFNGRLIIGPPNGGTIDRASPQGRLGCYLEHFVVDVLPSIYCCVGVFADCGSYYQKRPSRDETGYRLPVPGEPIQH